MKSSGERDILRDLVRRYLEIARHPRQETVREKWRGHNSLEPDDGPPPVLVQFGLYNVWCRAFIEAQCRCSDPTLRNMERGLRLKLFAATLDDDTVFEPWWSVGAVHVLPPDGLWGLREGRVASGGEGGAFAMDPPLKALEDVARLTVPQHRIDEAATAARLGRLEDAVGDLITLDRTRGSAYGHFNGDISTRLAQLRGLEQTMLDMYENPEWLHGLLAFMRDGILRAQQQAEDAGDYSLTCHDNQGMPYSRELEDPRPNSGPRARRQLWGFMAAQEFTLISPRMHEEFLLRYQRPIMAPYGLTHYGCCENLTAKIDLLRTIPNLRRIAVTPSADLARCAEQIGRDYVISWRPNPTDMVCAGFDADRIRRIVRAGRATCRANGCVVDLSLKDIETVEDDPGRLAQWVRLVRAAWAD
ncbi:MAG: hypothetical protein K9N49_01020 [Candidatus Marinimicrobia bacterium]|nr:hypothetical protein [Candidatus Neomarinimicrobiota bacterium]